MPCGGGRDTLSPPAPTQAHYQKKAMSPFSAVHYGSGPARNGYAFSNPSLKATHVSADKDVVMQTK